MAVTREELILKDEEEFDQALYDRLLTFLAQQTGREKSSLQKNTSLYHDLGIDGLEALVLMGEFQKSFGVIVDEVDFDQFFGPELPFNPVTWLFLVLFKPDEINPKGQQKKIPLRVADLYTAAKIGAWPAELCTRPRR